MFHTFKNLLKDFLVKKTEFICTIIEKKEETRKAFVETGFAITFSPSRANVRMR